MSLDHVSEELYELLRGDLSNRQMLVVNDHLRSCEACRQDLVDASVAHALLASVSDLLAPEFSNAGRAGDAERVASDLPPLGLMGDASSWVEGGPGAGRLPQSFNRPLRSFEWAGYHEDHGGVAGVRGSASLRQTAAELPPANAGLPLAGALGADRGDAGARTVRPHRRRPPSARRPRRGERIGRAMYRSGIVAVAVVVLVFATVLSVGSLRQSPTPEAKVLLTAELVALPAAPNASGSVTVRADGDVSVATAGLTPAPRGHYLEVWLVDPGRSGIWPLGILPSTGKGKFAFPKTLWNRHDGVTVSLQRNGAPPSLGVKMLSTLRPASHRVSDSLSSLRSGRAHHPRVPTHSHRLGTGHRRSQRSGLGGRPSTSGPGSVQPPPVVRRLLHDKERHLSSGRVLLVDTTSDSNAVSPKSGLCRDIEGRCSLRAAMEVADALRTPVTIRLPAGTYAIDLGALVASDPAGLSIVGTSAARSVIISQQQRERVFVVRDAIARSRPAGAILRLSHLTVSGGTAPATGTWGGDGGAILVANAAALLELSQVAIVDSHAALAGGGLFARGQVWATAATFENDSAGVSGGAADFAHSEAVVAKSVFVDDSAGSGGARGGEGGAITDSAAALLLVYSSFVDDAVIAVGSESLGGALDVRGPAWLESDAFEGDHVGLLTSFDGSATEAGGAVYVASGPVTVEESIFEDDEAEGSGSMGGALFNRAALTILSTRFSDDETMAGPPVTAYGDANGDGGAIYDGAELTLGHSWLSGNSASGDGGAVYANGTAMIADSVLSRNRALGGGGAIYDGASLTVTGSTLSHGLALYGGGLFVEGSLAADGDAIVDNLATGAGAAGGGVLVVGRAHAAVARTVEVARSTIAGNLAPAGAGIAEQTGVGRVVIAIISRSEIAGNQLPSGTEQDCAAIGPGAVLFLVSGGGNVVGDTSCGLSLPSDRAGLAAQGFWLASPNGVVRTYASSSYGSPAAKGLASPVVAMAAAPGNDGYWEVTANGAVTNFGSASWFGSARGLLGNSRVTSFAATLDGGGYWLVTSDGRVFNFGDAGDYGSARGEHIVAMARSVDGRGYWLLAADGEVRAFGDAPSFANGARFLAAAIAATPDGQGYWVAAADGTVHAFGDATNYGGTLTTGVVALLPSADGRGYLIVSDQGGVFVYGDATWSWPASSGQVAAATST
ncbi:MAG: anti-sigma factor [Acidimicrobiales bacterium]